MKTGDIDYILEGLYKDVEDAEKRQLRKKILKISKHWDWIFWNILGIWIVLMAIISIVLDFYIVLSISILSILVCAILIKFMPAIKKRYIIKKLENPMNELSEIQKN